MDEIRCPVCNAVVLPDMHRCASCGFGEDPAPRAAASGATGAGAGSPGNTRRRSPAPKPVKRRKQRAFNAGSAHRQGITNGWATVWLVRAIVVIALLIGGLWWRVRDRGPITPPDAAAALLDAPLGAVNKSLEPGVGPSANGGGGSTTTIVMPADWPEVHVPVIVPATWVPVSDPGGGFLAQLPATPRTRDLGDGSTGRTYQADLPDGGTAAVTWFTVDPAPTLPLADRLLGAVDRLTSGDGAGASSTKIPVRFRGLPAVNLRVSSPTENTAALCVLRDDKLVCVGLSGTTLDLATLGLLVNALAFP